MKVKIYDFLIELPDIDWKIRRILEVQENIKLDELHQCLQAAMGWKNCHWHVFEGANVSWGDKSLPDSRGLFDFDTRNTTLATLVKKTGERFEYQYDFGDCWDHIIEVSNLRNAEAGETYPKLIEAFNHCPLEDSGGADGYMHKCRVLKDPEHPDYERIKEWTGPEFHPFFVDFEQLQADVQKMAAKFSNKPIRKTAKTAKKSSRKGQWVWVGPSGK